MLRDHLLYKLAGVGVIALLLVAAGYLAGHGTLARTSADDPHQSRADQPQPGFADVSFLQDMSMHHDQAVLMSLIALNQAGPVVRRFATSIAIAQSRQVGQMRGWLQLWDKPQQSATLSRWLSMCGATPEKTRMMPGMATTAELQKFRSLSGKKFDVMYLQLMLRHHLGGIHMARCAVKQATLKKTRHVARAEAIQQIKEAGRMRLLLKNADAKPLPFSW